MAKRYISAYAKCPFYASEDAYRIVCEGIVEGSSIHLVFGDPSNKKRYQRTVCCDKWSTCEIAQMLERKWEEKNDTESKT